jgi:hypothetical protein
MGVLGCFEVIFGGFEVILIGKWVFLRCFGVKMVFLRGFGLEMGVFESKMGVFEIFLAKINKKHKKHHFFFTNVDFEALTNGIP